MLVPVPRGMSTGFYAFMGAGCLRSESGEMLMEIPDPNPPVDSVVQVPEEEDAWPIN